MEVLDAVCQVLEIDPNSVEVNYAFVSSREIHRLNQQFRQVDKVTDVLSFPDGDLNPETGRRFMGDVLICREVAKKQAKEIGIEVNLKGADWDTIYQNMYSSAALMQQTSPDPYKSIYQQYHSKEADDFYMNPGLYNNTDSDKLMEEAMHTNDLSQADSLWAQSALVNGGGWGPAGDAPFAWLVNYDYNYFIKDGIDIGEQPDGLGNDILINICEWKRA